LVLRDAASEPAGKRHCDWLGVICEAAGQLPQSQPRGIDPIASPCAGVGLCRKRRNLDY
jgi:hypothetical protein